MATIQTLIFPQSDENIIQQLITRPLPVDADLFDVADNCAALVTVLVESDDSVISSALCERLLQALHRLRELCDADLPPNLIEQLIVGENDLLRAGLLARHRYPDRLCAGTYPSR